MGGMARAIGKMVAAGWRGVWRGVGRGAHRRGVRQAHVQRVGGRAVVDGRHDEQGQPEELDVSPRWVGGWVGGSPLVSLVSRGAGERHGPRGPYIHGAWAASVGARHGVCRRCSTAPGCASSGAACLCCALCTWVRPAFANYDQKKFNVFK